MMMAFPEPPSFYPVMRMPAVDRPVPRNVCPPLRPFLPPSPPPQSFPPLNMQNSPMLLPPRPFHPPPPHMLPLPPPANLPPPPGMPNPHTAPMQLPLRPLPPPNMQDPYTPPSSAPPTPLPILELNHQNDILTQKWQWLPSMLCSLANDLSGDVYKIISITWDGSCKECYIKKQGKDGDHVPRVDKDVLERELVPAVMHAPPRPPMTPPSERAWIPGPPESNSDQSAPIQIFDHGSGNAPPPPIQIIHHDNGSAPPAPIQIIHHEKMSGPPGFERSYNDEADAYPGPKPAYVEDYPSDEDEDYGDRPPLSPAMASRGVFPADEEYYSNSNRSYDSRDDEYDDEHDSYERRGEGYAAGAPAFIALGPPAGQRRDFDEPSARVKKSHGDKHRKKHHRDKSEKSDRSEKSESERGSRKSKSKSSRRNSTSSEKDEKKEKKESSHSHRDRRQKKKPGLFGF